VSCGPAPGRINATDASLEQARTEAGIEAAGKGSGRIADIGLADRLSAVFGGYRDCVPELSAPIAGTDGRRRDR
jgi:hypothetical protein